MKFDVSIIGGGPAGSVLAAKLAQMGLKLCLVERTPFPRPHLGESLTPGVRSLLASIGATSIMEQPEFIPVTKVKVHWDMEREREDPEGQGLLVDRGDFDSLLLAHARRCGVTVLQPATVKGFEHRADGWDLSVLFEDRSVELQTRFLADATGRAGFLPRRRIRTGAQTIALYAYWKGEGLPLYPRIEAGISEWFWGVPLPGGNYNTLVFLNPSDLRSMSGTLDSKFHQLINRSSLFPPGAKASIIGSIQVTDASPYLDEELVSRDSIKVGDAALALDPLSSSGVQRAIQSALAGSIVVNTILKRPQSQLLAQRFYRESVNETSFRHRMWTRNHYAQINSRQMDSFWKDRSESISSSDFELASVEMRYDFDSPIQLSSNLQFVDRPCIVDQFVESRSAAMIPSILSPVVYLGDLEIVPLLRCFREGMTPRELVQSWRPRVDLRRGKEIFHWMISKKLIVSVVEGSLKQKGLIV